MSRDHFSALGLTPGRYSADEIAARFAASRAEALQRLDEEGQRATAERDLDRAHLAYRALGHPVAQEACLRVVNEQGPFDRTATLRRIIDWSLEGGLLRYSRRQQILEAGRALGFSEFHVHLMIAQAQFCDDDPLAPSGVGDYENDDSAGSIRARITAIALLALALFIALMRWSS